MSGPGSIEQRTLKALHDRKAQIQEEVFTSPPKDWAEFQHRFGQWEENGRLLASFLVLAKALEDEMPP